MTVPVRPAPSAPPAQAAPPAPARLAVCVDVGSTYTKLAVVDLETGALAATAEHRTTVDTDVMHGVEAVLAAVRARLPGADLSTVYACSSAGGGLRLAVVGYEPLVSARAAQRVALTAGARVVHVAAGRLDGAALRLLRGSRPDVVLLVGGTDGGDADVLRHNAGRLAGSRLRVPVVLAGNADARDDVTATLTAAGVPVAATGNVLPRIGELAPGPARAAIREVFLRHVIGGKRLSRRVRFARLVRGPTPDIVLTGVELLADTPPAGAPATGADLKSAAGVDVLVVDVGGATTDVYSILAPGAGPDVPARVAGTLWRARTVEGDLGVRWNAPGIVAAARAEGLLLPAEAAGLAGEAQRRADHPDLLDTGDLDTDLRLAGLAATVALRRHARGEAGGTGRDSRDLRGVGLVVASGGVFRHAPREPALAVLAECLRDHGGGWPLPRAPRLAVDADYILAPAGLLAADHPAAAAGLLRRHLHRR